MPEAFVSLREWLAPSESVEIAQPLESAPLLIEEDDDEGEYLDVVREVRFFRAALREALNDHVRMLVREIAVEVVSRELQLAPTDIAQIVERACARYAQPLSIRVHPSEAHEVRGFDDVVSDESIRRGDVMLIVCGGEVDASLGMRLARVLAAVGV